MIDQNIITSHYEVNWGRQSEAYRWKSGPMEQLSADFRILVFPPSNKRKMWSYATCGMSLLAGARAVELHLFSPVKTDAHLELLTAIAHFHTTGQCLDLGHTINLGRPWLPGSSCDHGLISLPYLDGQKLEWFETGDCKIHFLWLIPITSDEVKFKKQHGWEALEAFFENCNFDYLDALRKSVVQK